MDKKRRLNKKAQLTIFIIIALVIIAILLILFYPRLKIIVTGPSAQDYVSDCVEEATEEVLEILTVQGGSLEPENYVLYQGNKVDYACYTNEYYKKCTMQKPFLKQDVEQEIISYIEPRVKACLASLKSELEGRGSSVSLGEVSTDVSIVPNSIVVTVNAPMTITKGETISYNKFRTDIRSQLYDLLMLSSSIANYEARYGDSDSLVYMMYYPDIKVEKKKLGDESTIYILTERTGNEKFMFASRSIAWPPGYIGV